MNFPQGLMTRLSDAATRLSAGVHDAFTPEARGEAAYDRLRDALVPALDQFVAALTRSGRMLQESAKSGVELLQDNAQAIGKAVEKQRGMLARHPYLVAVVVLGTGYVAYQQLRERPTGTHARTNRVTRTGTSRGAHAGTSRANAGTRTNAGARKSAAARKSTGRAATRAQRERRQRAGTPAAETESAAKAVH